MAVYFDPGVEVNRLELLCFVAMDAQTDLASVYLFSSQIQPLVTLNKSVSCIYLPSKNGVPLSRYFQVVECCSCGKSYHAL